MKGACEVLIVFLVLGILFLIVLGLIKYRRRKQEFVEIRNLKYKTLNKPKNILLWDGIKQESEAFDVKDENNKNVGRG